MIPIIVEKTIPARMRANSYAQLSFFKTMPLAYIFFVCTLCFAPLAFGTTEIWSLATVELLSALAALCWFCKQQNSFYTIPGLPLLLCLLTLAALQTLPLPLQFVTFFSPNTSRIYQPFLLLQGGENWIPLTVHLKATVVEWLRISGYMLFFCLTVQLLTDKTRLKYTVITLVILSVLLAFYAILQRFISPHKIYGFREIPASAWQGALGPWVNPNQYAGFVVMVCPLALALFFTLQPRGLHKHTFGKRLLHLLSTPTGNLKIFLGFGIVLLVSSLFFSHSRGGILSILAAFICFLTCMSATSIKPRKHSALMFVAALFLAAALFNWQPVAHKFRSTIDPQQAVIHDGRIKVWHDSLAIIKDFPLTGTGFGTFADSFPAYKSFTDIYVYEHAHNDYVELLTDGGIPVFLLFAWFMMIILQNGWQQLKLRRDPQSVLLTTGALSGVVGMLVYSCTDFNLHNGADGLYFFFLCGLVISAGHTKNHSRSRPTLLQLDPTPLKRKILIGVSGIILGATPLVMGGILLAEKQFEQALVISKTMMLPDKKKTILTVKLRKAHRYDPLEARYTYVLANLKQMDNQEQALHLYTQTLYRQPMETQFVRTTGKFLLKKEPTRARQLLNYAKKISSR